jgi:hypothetical protein
MVNDHRIGVIQIIRQEEYLEPGANHEYHWTADYFAPPAFLGDWPTEQLHKEGTLTHKFSDGAMALIAKVMRAWEGAK